MVDRVKQTNLIKKTISLVLSFSIILALCGLSSSAQAYYVNSRHPDAFLKYYALSLGNYTGEWNIARSNWISSISLKGCSSKVTLTAGTSTNREFTLSYTSSVPTLYDSYGNLIPWYSVYGLTRPFKNNSLISFDSYEQWDYCYVYVFPSSISYGITLYGYPSNHLSTFVTKVTAHEVGHTFGLNENTVSSSLMKQGLTYVLYPSSSDMDEIHNLWHT